MEPIDIGTVAGSVTAFYIALSAILKKTGYISLQNPKNGNGNGNKYDPKQCRVIHKDIDIGLKGLIDKTDTHEKRLDQGSTEFNDVKGLIAAIDKNVAVLLDRSKNRRAGD